MLRTTGIILIITGLVIGVIGMAFLLAGLVQGSISVPGMLLGAVIILFILVIPLVAGGVVLMEKSKKEGVENKEAEDLRMILDMVKTRGEVTVSDVIIELGSDLPAVQQMIYKLVGMQLFSGYVNWDEGVLYSMEASAIRDLKICKNCGGEVSFAGKGVVQCPYCGTEYFI